MKKGWLEQGVEKIVANLFLGRVKWMSLEFARSQNSVVDIFLVKTRTSFVLQCTCVSLCVEMPVHA